MKLKLSATEIERMSRAAVQVLLKEQMEAAIRDRVNEILREIGDTEVTPDEIIAKYLATPPTIQVPQLVVPQ